MGRAGPIVTLVLLGLFAGASAARGDDGEAGAEAPDDGIQLGLDPSADGDGSGGFELGDDGFDIDEVDLDEDPWWELHGRGSLISAFYPKSDERTVDGVTGHTFSLSSIAIFLGLRITDDLWVKTEVEYVGEDGGEIELDLAVLEWEAVEKLLTVSVGINYVPFGVERFYYAPNRNPLIDRPAPFRRVFPGTYGDLGVFVKGRLDTESGFGLRWELAVVNGLRGPERDDRPTLETNIVRDNNDDKAVAGRLGAVLRPGLEIGASGYVGRHDDDARRLLHLFGVDLRAEVGGFRLVAEYVLGNVEEERLNGGSFHRWGYYVTLVYRWEPEVFAIDWLEGSLRIDGIDGDSRVRDHLDVDRLSAGLGWSPVEHFFVKLEYQWAFERGGSEIDNDLFFIEVGAWF